VSVNPVAGLRDLIAERDRLREELAEHRAAAVVIKPGDRVLVVLKRDSITHQEAHTIKGLLENRFPGSVFTVIPDSFLVVQPDDPEREATGGGSS
jgi:hypothetical protein